MIVAYDSDALFITEMREPGIREADHGGFKVLTGGDFGVLGKGSVCIQKRSLTKRKYLNKYCQIGVALIFNIFLRLGQYSRKGRI